MITSQDLCWPLVATVLPISLQQYFYQSICVLELHAHVKTTNYNYNNNDDDHDKLYMCASHYMNVTKIHALFYMHICS